jgi:hypothetical protein
MDKLKIDLRKNPYRGIVVEIAREEECAEGSVRYALKVKNPRICEIFLQKAEARRLIIERYEKLMSKSEVV